MSLFGFLFVPIRIVLDSPAIPLLPISILLLAGGEIRTGLSAQCDVVAAGCVDAERIMTDGRVVVAGGVGKERAKAPVAVLLLPVVLLRSALRPLAVLSLPVVLT